MARRAYAPGEKIDLSGSTMCNNSELPVTVRVVLRQHVRIQTTGYSRHETGTINRFELWNTHANAGESVKLDDTPMMIPAVHPSFFGANGSAVARREPLIISYDLSLQAKAKSGHKVKVELPILVSALPPTASAIEEASTSSESIPITTHPFDIGQYAFVNDGYCNTVAPVTGFEDINGTVVSAQGGGVNIYEASDAGSGFNSYHYDPQIVVFSSDESQTPSIPTAPTAAPTGQVDHTAAYNTLIDRMNNEYDSRLVVDRWIKEYPIAASQLTPDEFGGILKKVLMSMEQTTVARELVIGMNTTLTTQHILSALQICQFSKLDILRVMAPYVVDPENKDQVLSELYSFERDEAVKYFKR